MPMHLRCASSPGAVGSDQQTPEADSANRSRITMRAAKVEGSWMVDQIKCFQAWDPTGSHA